MSDDGAVTVAVDGGVAWVVFDRPAKHNALTRSMLAELPAVAERLDTDPAVRAVVLRGAGERAFVSGADLGMLDATGATSRSGSRQRADLFGALHDIGKPVLAMVRGWCLGGGVLVAMAADVRIAADDAVFGIPASTLGVAYPPEGVARLVSLVGPAHASELLFRANRIDAHEAERIGLVNRVVPASRLEAEVREAALEMAERAPLSHAAHKLAVAAALRPESAELAAAAREAEARAWASEDCAEGRRAFAEKREPRFTGN